MAAEVGPDGGAGDTPGPSRHVILTLRAESRGRINGVFFSIFYLGGAIGSAIGGWTHAIGGSEASMAIGVAIGTAALVAFATEAVSGPEDQEFS